MRIRLFFAICLILASCEADENPSSSQSLLTSVYSSDNNLELELVYNNCQLVRYSSLSPLSSNIFPDNYIHPLGLVEGFYNVDFEYVDGETLPHRMTVISYLSGDTVSRLFEVESNGNSIESLIELRVSNSAGNNQPDLEEIKFYYDSGHIDSINYKSGYGVKYFRSDVFNEIESVRYSVERLNLASEEFYRFENSFSNILSRLPIKYINTYPFFWSEGWLTVGSLDIRRYSYTFAGENIQSSTLVITSDSSITSRWNFTEHNCL